ncbi:unnamed protein product [Closterium sp. NIES-54]
MPPPNPTLMQPRAWLALVAVLWAAAIVFPPCDAQPINASQAVFLRDSQKAWNQTFVNWEVGADCAYAEGLTCDDSGMITEIILCDGYLEGLVPPDLYRDYHDNPYAEDIELTILGGSIPDSISSLTSLMKLSMARCQLNALIPAGIGHLASLEYLNLQENKIYGPIPVGIGNLTNLTFLRCLLVEAPHPPPPSPPTHPLPPPLLPPPCSSFFSVAEQCLLPCSHNHPCGSLVCVCLLSLRLSPLISHSLLNDNALSGSIPDTISMLTNLNGLDLSNNALTGSIPGSISALSALGALYERCTLNLAINKLTGPIPAGLGNLDALNHLNVVSNHLNGTIPPSLGGLLSLQHLYLSVNALTGSIPNSISSLVDLRYLSLDGNNLNGTIPSTLGGLSSLQSLYLERNHLNGTIPYSLGNLLSLESLLLTSTIPPTHTHRDLSNNTLTGSIPDSIYSLPNLRYLYEAPCVLFTPQYQATRLGLVLSMRRVVSAEIT